MPCKSTCQAAARARSENDADSASGDYHSAVDSWAGQMEAEEQQLPGAGNHGQGVAVLNVPDDPAVANMQPVVRLGRGGARLLPMPVQASQAGYRNPPVQSPDALAVASVLSLINMVRSQDASSHMLRAELDRWHQHGKLFMSSLKIASFGEVPMTTGDQQKLLI
jgi:hypothetical protein